MHDKAIHVDTAGVASPQPVQPDWAVSRPAQNTPRAYENALARIEARTATHAREQERREIAARIMASFGVELQTNMRAYDEDDWTMDQVRQDLAWTAVAWADALIAELDKPKP